MSLPLRIVRAQFAACALLCALTLPAGGQVFWSAACGAASCLAPSALVGVLTWRGTPASSAAVVMGSLVKLFGAAALLAVALVLPVGLLPKVVVGAFLVCALAVPLIAARVAAEN